MAITMGDASGVGPEIVLASAAAGSLGADVVVYGDVAVLRRGNELLGLEVDVRPIDDPARPSARSAERHRPRHPVGR